MTSRLESITAQMLVEYERNGRLKLADWIEQAPDLSKELVDFAFWLDGTPEAGQDADSIWRDTGSIAKQALARALERTKEAAGMPEEAQLAAQLQRARLSIAGHRYHGKASKPFRRAAVQAWVFNELRGTDQSVSRFMTNKAVYLLERALRLDLFTRHQKMAYGPYDPSLRYKDAEPIARQRGWLNTAGPNLCAGPKLADAQRYAKAYLVEERAARAFLIYLSTVHAAEWETLATVDMAAIDLLEGGRAPTPELVTQAIRCNPTWAPKLAKGNFTAQRIANALARLSRLGLLQDSRLGS